MITLRVWFVVSATAMVLAATSVWTAIAGPARGSRAISTPAVTSVGPASSAPWIYMGAGQGFDSSRQVTDDLFSVLEPATQPRLDVYGNEIDDAVTDYRIDRRGDVYERHSPETEVPRLAPPVS
jgi:hypothetical protein